MRIALVTHCLHEGAGCIQEWMDLRGYELLRVRMDKQEPFPDTYDALFLMGGPQSATELPAYEVAEVKKAIQRGICVVGICLGAQLIGRALGAPPEKSPHPEVGFYPIELTTEGKSDLLTEGFPPEFLAFHWHGEMMGLPPGSQVLAKSAGCPRQVVRFGERVMGFQCHFEMTFNGAEDMIHHSPQDLAPGKYIQSKEEILRGDFRKVNQRMFEFLNSMEDHCA